MPRKIRPKLCGCGCGEKTRGGQFLPGHDSKTLSAIVEYVGGTLELKRIVEDALDCRIPVNTGSGKNDDENDMADPSIELAVSKYSQLVLQVNAGQRHRIIKQGFGGSGSLWMRAITNGYRVLVTGDVDSLLYPLISNLYGSEHGEDQGRKYWRLDLDGMQSVVRMFAEA